jgi:hypothetical protein
VFLTAKPRMVGDPFAEWLRRLIKVQTKIRLTKIKKMIPNSVFRIKKVRTA